MHGSFGYSFRPPTFDPFGIHKFDFSKSSELVCALLIMFGILTLLVYNLQRSASGRAMLAVRSSSVAAQASGISPARAQVALFALSAGIAGFGGAMYGLTSFSITKESVPPVIGLIWIAVAVTFGVRRPGGALLAGLSYTAAPVMWKQIASFSWMPHFVPPLITSSYFTAILFGLGAINLAKNPDGILAMVGSDRLEKRRAKQHEARIAAAESGAARRRGDGGRAGGAGGRGAGDGRRHRSGTPGVEPAILLEDGEGGLRRRRGAARGERRGGARPGRRAAGSERSRQEHVVRGRRGHGAGALAVGCSSRARTCRRCRRSAASARGSCSCPKRAASFPGSPWRRTSRCSCATPPCAQKTYERFPILGERRKQVAGLLSGGEQQMLSLAPALADPPVVLVADEPTLGLAPLAAAVVIDALRELRELGTAILLVEEKASEVMKVADIIAFMELGRVVWMGPREEADAERLAAAYLGTGTGKRQD